MTTRSPRTLLATLLAIASAGLALSAAPGTALAAGEPNATMDGPSGQITIPTATYTFSSTEPGTTFECAVDAAAWTPCASPWTVTLADGDHALAVRAVDEAGNVDPTPATRTVSVDTSGVETKIDGGPEGLGNDRTPTFLFSTDVVGATFECRITGPDTPLPAFTPCSAPLTTPALTDGAFVFEARAVSAAGRPDGTPAKRAFLVDGSAPETELTGGPAEGADAPTRTPRFTYRSEAGARFECRVDPRSKQDVELVPWKACDPAGFTTPLLRGGQRSFEVRAVDPAGNPDPTPAKRSFWVVACEQDVRFGLVQLQGECIQGTGTDEEPTYESEKSFTLNGLPIPVVNGAKAVIKAPVGSNDGLLTVKDVLINPKGIQLFKGDLSLKLPAGGQGDEKEAIAFSPAGKLFGMQIAGKAALRLGWPRGTDERRAVIALSIALPEVFKAGPSGGAGSVTGDVAIRVDPTNGVQLDGLKIQVGNAYIGSLGIKTLCLSYLRAGATFVAGCQAPSIGKGESKPFISCTTATDQDRWDGALAVILPTASKTELGVWGGTSGGKFSHGGAYADNLGTAVPLAPGVFLDRVAIGVCVQPPPFKIKGEVGVGLGPSVNGVSAVKLNGYMEYTDAYNGKPWQITAGGSLILFGYKMASGEMTYLSSGMLDFSFEAGFDFKVAKLKGDVKGWVETKGSRRFNVEGRIEICAKIVGCVRGTALVSSVGAAGCATIDTFLGDITGGVGFNWGGKPKLMGGSCSIGPWRAKRTALPRLDSAGNRLQAAVPTSFLVGERARGVAVRVRGAGGIPKVAFVGPDGRRISTDVPDGQGYDPKSHLIIGDEEVGEVSILIGAPAEGAWRIEVLPGSVPVTGVDTADPLPDPQVEASVSGQGRDLQVDYAYTPAEGRTVMFAELGARTARELGTPKAGPCKREADRKAGRVCGSLRFSPADGGAGTRTIRAQVQQGGEPVEASVVARFRAPADLMPARPKLQVQRGPGSIRVAWKAIPGADKINVVVTTKDGRRVLFTRQADRKGAVVLRGVRATVGARVVARGMRTDVREGRATAITVKPRAATTKKAPAKARTKTGKTTTTRSGSTR